MTIRKKTSVIKKEELKFRPPVVAVLGHVDHGKTTLLDAIRKTNIAGSEAGGITQNIGAYQINFTPAPTSYNPHPASKTITFIDTPGHLAFSQMRSRGVGVADIVALVVAANEGVKPQTLESLKHIKSAKAPFLVVLTKVDLPDTYIERVKKDLAKHGVLLEGYGGSVVSVPVSGKTGKGINELLEMIIIIAEMAELEGSFSRPLKGVVIESKVNPQRGVLATVIVRDGCLRLGDQLKAGDNIAKVRAMFDEKGKRVASAGPSVPVEVLGFRRIPEVGIKVEKAAAGKGEKIVAPAGQSPTVKTARKEEEGDEEKLKVILKVDSVGSLEAITESLPDQVRVVNSGIGNISGSDIFLAETTGAQIFAFNVRVSTSAKKLAETEGIKIAVFSVIYQLLEEIEKRVLKLIEPEIDEVVLGRAEIIEVFEIKKERIAGCRVVEGEVKKSDRLHLSRKEETIGDCRFKSLRSGKREIETVKKGEEFGAILSLPLDFDIGDVLISFRKTEEP